MSNSCFDCISRQPPLPFNNSEPHSTASFDLIHYEVWGPSPVVNMSSPHYFVIFVDDFSCYT
jgi:hypothetical protein